MPKITIAAFRLRRASGRADRENVLCPLETTLRTCPKINSTMLDRNHATPAISARARARETYKRTMAFGAARTIPARKIRAANTTLKGLARETNDMELVWGTIRRHTG